jgi:acetyltransferase-like isoleucine patch superfamily enzyme
MTREPSGAVDFGTVYRARGFLRRRLGLALTRIRHPRVVFGPRCDVRSGCRFTVARGADVRFGSSCVLDHGFTLESSGHLEVGDRTVFGHHCTVAADRSVVIGAHCLIGELVSIRDHDHAFGAYDGAIIDQGRVTAPVRIGDDVWIGAKATVTRGVTIGSGAVVGAHAVVTHDLPAGCIAVGIPAKVIRMRDGGSTPD